MNRARKGMENPRSIMPEELPKLTSNNTALVPPQLKKGPERYQKIAGGPGRPDLTGRLIFISRPQLFARVGRTSEIHRTHRATLDRLSEQEYPVAAGWSAPAVGVQPLGGIRRRQ